jgi:hypothetical protein
MKSLALYNHPGRDPSSNVDSGGGGGDVEDTLNRLGSVEANVFELKSQVSGILAILPHLATKADVADVRTDVANVRTDVAQLKGDMAANISGLEARMIKWIVATLLTSAGLAFTIAKVVH